MRSAKLSELTIANRFFQKGARRQSREDFRRSGRLAWLDYSFWPYEWTAISCSYRISSHLDAIMTRRAFFVFVFFTVF